MCRSKFCGASYTLWLNVYSLFVGFKFCGTSYTLLWNVYLAAPISFIGALLVVTGSGMLNDLSLLTTVSENSVVLKSLQLWCLGVCDYKSLQMFCFKTCHISL